MDLQSANKKIVDNVKIAVESRTAKVVQWILIITVLLLIIWDIFLYKSPSHDTISTTIFKNTTLEHMFVLPWVWGILAGHLFLTRNKDEQRISEIVAALLIALITVIFFFVGTYIGPIFPMEMHAAFFILGVLCGYFLWPQVFEKEKSI